MPDPAVLWVKNSYRNGRNTPHWSLKILFFTWYGLGRWNKTIFLRLQKQTIQVRA
jgi:hypothetical protein